MARMLVFDFDSTLIKDESLVSLLKSTLRTKSLTEKELQDAAKEIEQITLDGISGKISMIDSYRRRLAIAKPTKKSVEEYVNNSNDLLTPGMSELISQFRAEFPDVPIYVISQGPKAVVAPISHRAFGIPIENVHAVDLTISENDQQQVEYVAEDEPMLNRGKSKTLSNLVNTLVDTDEPKQIVVVGDGVSDMKMKTEGVATTAIGFGVHLQFKETRNLSDYYVTDVNQLYPILSGLFKQNRNDLDAHIRQHEVFNFFPGPAIIPTSVLQQVNDELLNYQHRLGYSVLEMSHRSKDFTKIINDATKNLRELLNVPNDYEILYMQGGASLQFSAIPMNLCRLDLDETCDYLASGIWSKKAAEEATKCLGHTKKSKSSVHLNQVTNEQLVDLLQSTSTNKINLSENSQFLYYCDNETVNGTEFEQVPPIDLISQKDQNRVRWVCDMSSNFLTRKFDVSKFDLVYSCAQKNFGVAGLTVVIMKKSLLGHAPDWIPSLLDFKILADGQSLQNTPTTFSIYVANLIFEWMRQEGGMEEMERRCRLRSDMLYKCIDESKGFYVNNVPKELRSRVNVVLKIGFYDNKKQNEELEAKFVKQATDHGLVGLEGHRSVGGIRASLYNAQSVKAVEELITFMNDFQKENSIQ